MFRRWHRLGCLGTLCLVVVPGLTMPGRLAFANLPPPALTFELTGSSAAGTNMSYAGTAPVGSETVMVFTADDLSVVGAHLIAPCSAPLAPPVRSDLTTGAETVIDFGGPVIVYATFLSYAGPSGSVSFTPTSPPPGALPALMPRLDMHVYTLGAKTLSEGLSVLTGVACGPA